MTDWSTARTHTGDPADVFVALGELLELIHRPPWHADAACREHPRELFFPKPGQPPEPAKAICARCLVRDTAVADFATGAAHKPGEAAFDYRAVLTGRAR